MTEPRRCPASKDSVMPDQFVDFDPIEDGLFFMEAVVPGESERSEQTDWLLKRMADAAADPDAKWARCPLCNHVVQCFEHGDHMDFLPHTVEGRWVASVTTKVELSEMTSPSVTGGVITWSTA